MTQSMIKGLQCIIGRFQTRSISHLEVLKRINTAKQKEGLTFFMLSLLEAKIFQCGFVEEHKVCENNRY